MPDKPTKRNWNDVQVAIATAAIVTSIGMWNLFAAPAKSASTQATDPAVPPTDPPTDVPNAAMPHVKIIFTPGATQQTITTAALPQPQQQAPAQKSRSRGGGGGGAPVAHTKTS